MDLSNNWIYRVNVRITLLYTGHLYFRGPEDDTLNQVLADIDRSQKREIRRLEREILRWTMLLGNSGHAEG